MVTGGTTDDMIQLNIESFVGYHCRLINLMFTDHGFINSGLEARSRIHHIQEATLRPTGPLSSEMNSVKFGKLSSNHLLEKPIVCIHACALNTLPR